MALVIQCSAVLLSICGTGASLLPAFSPCANVRLLPRRGSLVSFPGWHRVRRGAACRSGRDCEGELLRCFIFRNSTCANGILEWAPSDPASVPGGRLRAFEAFGNVRASATPNAACTVAEIPYKEGGLGSKVWESSLALACWALMNSAAVQGKRVLELGSGCGFGGVMLAAAGAQSVILSDFHGEHEEFIVKDDGTLVSSRLKEGTGLYSVHQGVYADGKGTVSFPLLRNLEENVRRNKAATCTSGKAGVGGGASASGLSGLEFPCLKPTWDV